MANSTWSLAEVELIVADYFAMLAEELAVRPYNKAEHRQRLTPLLNGRSAGSIEFKHANISAVLVNFGLPYIDGYKPRFNYQQLLEQVVLERIEGDPQLISDMESSPIVEPERPGPADFSDLDALIEEAPDSDGEVGVHLPKASPGSGPAAPRHTDFAARDARNRQLGRQGEEWTLQFERRRLHDREGRKDLARQVVWVSQEEGDGAGYDIRSFEADGGHRLIEVKTTGLGKYHSFHVTRNELLVSEREAPRYHLYRLFRFGQGPRLYTLQGALSSVCSLEASAFKARLGREQVR